MTEAGSERLSVSWSRLKAYEECRQAVLRRKEGKAVSFDNGRNFLPGTIADRAMRAFLEQEDPKPGSICDPVDELFEKYAFNDKQYTIRWLGNPVADQQRVKDTVRMVLTNLEPWLWQKVLPYGYQPEARFRVTIGIPYLDGRLVAVDLIGGMDILTVTLQDVVTTDNPSGTGGLYGVYDLKATTNDSYVQGGILGQLVFYAIAVKAMKGSYPREVAFLTPGCKQQFVPLTITEQDVRHMMARVISYCHGVWRNEWQPKDPDSLCVYCDVRHACDLFRLPPGPLREDGKLKVSLEEMASRRLIPSRLV